MDFAELLMDTNVPTSETDIHFPAGGFTRMAIGSVTTMSTISVGWDAAVAFLSCSFVAASASFAAFSRAITAATALSASSFLSAGAVLASSVSFFD